MYGYTKDTARATCFYMSSKFRIHHSACSFENKFFLSFRLQTENSVVRYVNMKNERRHEMSVCTCVSILQMPDINYRRLSLQLEKHVTITRNENEKHSHYRTEFTSVNKNFFV